MKPIRAFEDSLPWHLEKVSDIIEINGVSVPHPALSSGIFVVHGMGMHTLTETAASLRNGIENALTRIEEWQEKEKISSPLGKLNNTPPPFVGEGFWADYTNLKASFPEDWETLSKSGARATFFEKLWKIRTMSAFRTFFWFIGQQASLLWPTVIFDVGFLAWLLYWPLQIVSIAILLILLLFARKGLAEILADVRLYVAPKGVVEKAIVQRIDYRVGSAFLRMLGLDWDFRPLEAAKLHTLGPRKLRFTRIVWVAHSLGSVISYNVLSDLFARAAELEQSGDTRQKRGVDLFRKGMRRFVTIGSPLDKVAYLFPAALRPWPDRERDDLLEGGEREEKKKGEGGGKKEVRREWWINFYHVLDPVSGSLSNKTICGGRPPLNFHVGLLKLPGLAHFGYWKDLLFLRFVLGRVYSKEFLADRAFRPTPESLLTLYAMLGYIVWAVLIVGFLPGMYFLVNWILSQGLGGGAMQYLRLFTGD